MRRFLLLAAVAGLVPAGARAAVPVPRVVIPAGALPKPGDPGPGDDKPADADGPEDPAKTAERIAKTAKALGDKLGDQDTGPGTLSGQEKLKKDIDSLIKALENPPPMSNQNSPMNNQQSGGGGGGGGGGSSGQPMGGGGQSGSRGQRRGGGGQQGGGGQKQPQPGGQDREPGGAAGEKGQAGSKPNAGGGKPQPGQAGGKPGTPGGQAGGGGQSTPALPLDESIARDFWGNLPDLPRQRMLQFFREQYMSRYKELLPQYYQSLAEKEKKGKK